MPREKTGGERTKAKGGKSEPVAAPHTAKLHDPFVEALEAAEKYVGHVPTTQFLPADRANLIAWLKKSRVPEEGTSRRAALSVMAALIGQRPQDYESVDTTVKSLLANNLCLHAFGSILTSTKIGKKERDAYAKAYELYQASTFLAHDALTLPEIADTVEDEELLCEALTALVRDMNVRVEDMRADISDLLKATTSRGT